MPVSCISRPLTDTTVEDFDRVIAINLRGAWLCTKHAVPNMVERGGGAIVNMSSLAGHIAGGGHRRLRDVEGGDHPPEPRSPLRNSVRPTSVANALLPAFVDTPMQQAAMTMFDEHARRGRRDAR